MNKVRFGILVLAALCVWAAWPKRQGAAPRPVMIKAALNQTSDPVIVLGDSIVEQAPLPARLCNRPVVNAGIGGSTTASGLDTMLAKAIGNKKAAMIVVSLGVNDAMLADHSPAAYRQNYQAMLQKLASLAPRVAVMAVTPIEPGGSATGQAQNARIGAYNAALPAIAAEAGATFIALPSLPVPSTHDGVHLNAQGYAGWTAALRDGVERALCPPS